MILKDIPGNDKLIRKLEYLATSENLSHAYIFEGDTCADKPLLINCFIKAILCKESKGQGCEECSDCHKINHGNHEDIIYLEADGKSIKDEAVERVQEKLKKKPFSGERNIVVIKDADTMTIRAQNRLLKTLEEPHPGTIIFLLSENIENLVQTILSRCVVFKVNPFETKEYAQIKEQAYGLTQMLLDKAPFYLVKIKLNEFVEDQESAVRLLDSMELIYRDLVIIDNKESRNYKKENLYRAVELIEQARRDLQRGINVGYAMKNLVIKIGG